MKYIRSKYRRVPLGLKALIVATALMASGLVLFTHYAEAANRRQPVLDGIQTRDWRLQVHHHNAGGSLQYLPNHLRQHRM